MAKVEQINDGASKISNYTWHHAEKTGEMQLVKSDVHDVTGHTGGDSIWGGGVRR